MSIIVEPRSWLPRSIIPENIAHCSCQSKVLNDAALVNLKYADCDNPGIAILTIVAIKSDEKGIYPENVEWQ
jgi:hypothetical protein